MILQSVSTIQNNKKCKQNISNTVSVGFKVRHRCLFLCDLTHWQCDRHKIYVNTFSKKSTQSLLKPHSKYYKTWEIWVTDELNAPRWHRVRFVGVRKNNKKIYYKYLNNKKIYVRSSHPNKNTGTTKRGPGGTRGLIYWTDDCVSEGKSIQTQNLPRNTRNRGYMRCYVLCTAFNRV